MSSVRRAGVEPAQQSRAGYSRLGSPMPSRHRVVSIPGRSRTCPATFGGSHAAATPREHFCQWTAGESHPDFRPAEATSSSWTSSPYAGPEGRRVNDGARTHLHRLHRPAAHCVAFIHHQGPERPESPRQDSNLRPPAPEAGAIVRYATRRYSAGEQGFEPRLPG